MVEILCTLTGIVAGVAIVASLMQGRSSRQQFVRRAPSDDGPGAAQMHGIADQLRLLSFRVAADVSAHSEKVEAISDRLVEQDAAQPTQILSAISELIAVNQTMQGQLADARKRIAHQSEMIEEAAQLARTDALTGLANRRALNEFLQSCLNAIRPNEVAGLLLLDIDHFKSFNDNYGHTTGDAVLSAFARNIKKWCKQQCYAARYGGEEFAVILTGRDSASLAQKAAELRKFVSEQTITFEDLQLNITASAGLCILASGDTLQSAYDRSDQGLYNAKKAGRNCGFWLNDAAWESFPEVQATASVDGEPKPAAQSAEELIRISQGGTTRRSESTETGSRRRSDLPELAASFNDQDWNISGQLDSSGHEPTLGDVLDLETFTSRVSVYIEQLRKADLPATGLLISLVGPPAANAEADYAWSIVQSVIQSQLRGIDVMGSYRERVGCVFLPGCSAEVAAERASRIQTLLEDARKEWPATEPQPERLAVAIATARANEEAGDFLKRLDVTLEKAQSAGKFELAVHDGQRVIVEGSVGG